LVNTWLFSLLLCSKKERVFIGVHNFVERDKWGSSGCSSFEFSSVVYVI